MEPRDKIQAFLDGNVFAVAGASSNRAKYGNKVLRVYQQNGRIVFPVNPREKEIEGLACYPDLAALPEPVHGLSIVTPPDVTQGLLEQAAAAGIRHVWMQPGAEPADFEATAARLGLSVIGGGPCILVMLGYHEG
jgi:predicted CoA-binding protein